MSRSNGGRNDEYRDYDDALGQMLRWSLHSEASRQKLSPQVWSKLQARLGEVDRRAAQRVPLRKRALQLARYCEQGVGTFLHAFVSMAGVGLQLWQYVDERTVSSEAVWQADAHSAPGNMLALRYRLTVQVVSAGPLLGQRLPII